MTMKGIFVLVVTFICMPFAVHADNITIPVPQSQLQLSPGDIAEPPAPHVWEFAGSNWAPIGYSESSLLPNTSNVQGDAFPQLSINLGSSPWKTKWVQISPKWGASYCQLERTGMLDFAGQGQSVSQALNLISFRAAAELTPTHQLFGFVVPYLEAAALPTWESAAESAFGDGISRAYWNLEMQGGLMVNIRPVAEFLGFQSFALEAAVEDTRGIIGSPLSGAGILLGSRVSM